MTDQLLGILNVALLALLYLFFARVLWAVWSEVRAPVRLAYGSADTVTPPDFGRWYATHLPGASFDLVDGAAHYLALTAWARWLASFT